MSERIKKLQQLKALAHLIRTAEEAKLAEARFAEKAVQDKIVSLREDRKTECAAAPDPRNAYALEAWLGWSSAQIEAEQARQARQRAQVEMRLSDFKKAFGRASAIDELLERERRADKQKRSRT
ncbi:hypothetical protein [Cognatishimia sp. MH4019]|uniref:hypothetical protein n=1 Tax=Cognatishimia sp. MH4019 TaxID=2854030 RepID=UPI001CD72BC2|nr:hypothetical protein [Cognatishimia sp. MH4019]